MHHFRNAPKAAQKQSPVAFHHQDIDHSILLIFYNHTFYIRLLKNKDICRPTFYFRQLLSSHSTHFVLYYLQDMMIVPQEDTVVFPAHFTNHFHSGDSNECSKMLIQAVNW